MTSTPRSLWMETAPAPERARLERSLEVDVAVLGAGQVGCALALRLAEAGLTVALLEMAAVGSGVTGNTTAKLTSQHQLIYADVQKRFGEEGARLYGQANEDALQWVRDQKIDCDLETQDAVVLDEDGSHREAILEEFNAARRAGLPAQLDGGSLRFTGQAQYHPRKLLLGLAERFEAAGGSVFEQTRATAVRDGRPARVETESGHTVTAEHVVVATHYPFLDRGLFFARMHAERSYCVAARLRGAAPEGMSITAGEPTRSLRRYGTDLLIVGGEGHKAGQGGDTAERYRRLEEWTRERYEVEAIEYRWSAQDAVSADGVPFVGLVHPGAKSILTATAFGKWGLTNGVAAAGMLADRILDRPNVHAGLFDPGRLKASGDLVTENADVGWKLLKGHLSPAQGRAEDLGPGEGAIVRSGRHKVAAYRDEQGELHGVSPVCTHLYCQVAWNGAERSWDCPCHGSRFDPDGRVLEGPAVKDLPKKEL